MQIAMVNVGHGNIIPADKIIAILNNNSAPIKKIIQEAKEQDLLINACQGRKARSVIMMSSNHVILSSVQTETIVSRMILREGVEFKKPTTN